MGIFAADKTNADIIYQCAKYMVEHTAWASRARPPGVVPGQRAGDRKPGRGRDEGLLQRRLHQARVFVFRHHYRRAPRPAQPKAVGRTHRRFGRRPAAAGSDRADHGGGRPGPAEHRLEIHEKCRRLLAWRRGEPERELDSDLPEWCPIMFGVRILTGDDPDRIDALDIYDEKNYGTPATPAWGTTCA